MSADKAARKLVAYQVADPRTFPLHLVACAVAGGASFFNAVEDINLTSFDFAYQFDGEPFGLEELQLLSQPLSGPEVPRRIKELALVLNAASTMGRAKFRSYQVDRALEVSVSDGTLAFKDIPNNQEPGQVLFFDRKGNPPTTEDWLRFCRHAPLHLHLNGEQVDRPIDLTTPRTYGRYLVKGSRELKVQCQDSDHIKMSCHELKDPQRRSLVLNLTTPHDAKVLGLLLVADGITTRVEASVLELPFLCGAVEVSDLTRDLSRRGFVEDKAYRDMIHEIKVAVDEFLNAFYRFPAVLRNPDAANFRVALHLYYGRAGIPREATPLVSEEGGDAFAAALKLQGEMAQDSEDWSEVEKTREKLRARASVARSEGEASAAWRALDSEQTLVNSSGKEDASLQFLLEIYQSLCIEVPPSHVVTKLLHNKQRTSTERFLALLLTLKDHTNEQQLRWLKILNVPKSWAALILFEMSMQGSKQTFDSGHQAINHLLSALVMAEKGSVKAALSRIRTFKFESTESQPIYLWLNSFWNAYRAKLSWPRAIALRADLSLNYATASQTEKDAQNRIAALSNTETHDGDFVHKDIFKANPLPQLCARLDATRKGDPKEAYQFLGHCLIQVMLGETGTPLTIPNDYPVNWLFNPQSGPSPYSS